MADDAALEEASNSALRAQARDAASEAASMRPRVPVLTPAGAAAAQDAHDEWQRERHVASFPHPRPRSHRSPYDRVRDARADP
jgi:hypothetical protein